MNRWGGGLGRDEDRRRKSMSETDAGVGIPQAASDGEGQNEGTLQKNSRVPELIVKEDCFCGAPSPPTSNHA